MKAYYALLEHLPAEEIGATEICQWLRQRDGMARAPSVPTVSKALQTMPASQPGEPNILLIAGGRDKGLDYHDLGPLLAQRVKQAFLLGETREKLRASWSLFTPCTLVDSLLEAVNEAARIAAPGDVVLLSPACSSFDQFKNHQHRGDVFRQAVLKLATAAGGGPARGWNGRTMNLAATEPEMT